MKFNYDSAIFYRKIAVIEANGSGAATKFRRLLVIAAATLSTIAFYMVDENHCKSLFL